MGSSGSGNSLQGLVDTASGEVTNDPENKFRNSKVIFCVTATLSFVIADDALVFINSTGNDTLVVPTWQRQSYYYFIIHSNGTTDVYYKDLLVWNGSASLGTAPTNYQGIKFGGKHHAAIAQSGHSGNVTTVSGIWTIYYQDQVLDTLTASLDTQTASGNFGNFGGIATSNSTVALLFEDKNVMEIITGEPPATIIQSIGTSRLRICEDINQEFTMLAVAESAGEDKAFILVNDELFYTLNVQGTSATTSAHCCNNAIKTSHNVIGIEEFLIADLNDGVLRYDWNGILLNPPDLEP